MMQDPLKDTNGGPQNWHTSYWVIWGEILLKIWVQKPKVASKPGFLPKMVFFKCSRELFLQLKNLALVIQGRL